MTDIQDVLKRHPNVGRDHLIPILQEVQEAQGYLSRQAVIEISQHLGLPASKIYGVATFYNQFRFQGTGRYHIMLCRGTACHVKGSANILETAKKLLNIEPGQTTRDGLFSLEIVACIGACGLAPVININGEFYAGVTSEKITDILENCRKEAQEHDANQPHA